MRPPLELTQGQDVVIVVTRSLTSCCGGGWKNREGEQRYEGRVATVTDQYFILYKKGLGRIMQVLVGWDDLLDWE